MDLGICIHIKITQVVKSLSLHKLYYILGMTYFILALQTKCIYSLQKEYKSIWALKFILKSNSDSDPFKNKGLCWKHAVLIIKKINFAYYLISYNQLIHHFKCDNIF